MILSDILLSVEFLAAVATLLFMGKLILDAPFGKEGSCDRYKFDGHTLDRGAVNSAFHSAFHSADFHSADFHSADFSSADFSSAPERKRSRGAMTTNGMERFWGATAIEKKCRMLDIPGAFGTFANFSLFGNSHAVKRSLLNQHVARRI